MGLPLDERYFTWLYSQVGSVRNRNLSKSYWKLLKLLYTKEFVWLVPNDDNRAEDGRDLRQEFAESQNVDTSEEPGWLRLGCDMLELLIGLSRRLAFEGEGEPRDWFWKLIENLDLIQYSDAEDVYSPRINDILDDVIWRTYGADGHGGLFPLKYPKEDQRDIELWYQMSAYLLER